MRVSSFQQRLIRELNKRQHSLLRSTTAEQAGIQSGIISNTKFRPITPQISLFPWRHDEQPLDRFIPGTDDNLRDPDLIGGGIITTNSTFDTCAAAVFFLGVPLHELVFFKAWQQDLAESFCWAFKQGVSGIISNTYNVPIDSVMTEEGSIDFSHLPDQSLVDDIDGADGISRLQMNAMMDDRLIEVYQSAHANGKDRLKIRLKTVPVSAEISNVFCFPFLSRSLMKQDPSLEMQYLEFIRLTHESPTDGLAFFQKMISHQFSQQGCLENTVICQVRLQCDEIFAVEDLLTGSIIQGHEDLRVRRVEHLVRMERVVLTEPTERGSFYPIRQKQGHWYISDIDDILDGNQLL